MSTLILFAIVAFSPSDVLVAGLVGFALGMLGLAFFYAPTKFWLAAVFLVPPRLVLKWFQDDPAMAEMPLMGVLPTLAAIAESLAAVALVVVTILGFMKGRPIIGFSPAQEVATAWRRLRT